MNKRLRKMPITNKREKEVLQKYEESGWIGTHRGGPNFLALRFNGAEIAKFKFVKLLTSSGLNLMQRLCKKVLKKKLNCDYKLEDVRDLRPDPEYHHVSIPFEERVSTVVKRYEEDDWIVVRGGWPDFLMLRFDDSEVGREIVRGIRGRSYDDWTKQKGV